MSISERWFINSSIDRGVLLVIQTKISYKSFIAGSILVFLICGIISIVLSNSKVMRNPYIIFGFLTIAMFSLYSILLDGRIISINKIIWFFCLIFMSIAPLCQYLSCYYPWGYKLSDEEYGKAQFVVIVFYLAYYLLYNVRDNIKIKSNGKHYSFRVTKYLCRERDFGFVNQLTIFICMIVLFMLLIRLNGFRNLFIKSKNTVDIENSTLRFVIKKFLSAFPAMATTVFIYFKKYKMSWIFIFIAFTITLLSNFPTSTTRYWMGTILLGILLNVFLKRRNSRIIDYAVLISIIVLFPLFYVFKTKTIFELLDYGYSYGGIVNSFNSVDFDAFTLVARAIKYVSVNGTTKGQQLMNVILFYIPRSVWKEKPITTNTLIASSQGQRFTNLSCPLPAEGYVNFGLIGVIIYSMVFALLIRYLDKVYWENGKNTKKNLINMIYPYLAIIVFYVSRGPLQPSFMQTIALLIPMITIVGLFGGKVKTRLNISGGGIQTIN